MPIWRPPGRSSTTGLITKADEQPRALVPLLLNPEARESLSDSRGSRFRLERRKMCNDESPSGARRLPSTGRDAQSRTRS